MKYNVTIVGAGPAGSTAAKFLSEQGYKVILIDKDKFPRDKPCGGGIPIKVLNRFNYVKNDRFIESYSYGGFAFSPSLKFKLESLKDTPIIATSLRKKFDYELVKIAKDSGAIFKDGNAVTNVKITNEKATVFLKDGRSIDSEIVIGAGGVWDIIAKKTGLRKKDYDTGICILQEFKVNKEIVDKYFKKERICYLHARFKNINGYGWIFPKKEHLNIGLGGAWTSKGGNINLKKYYKDYIAFLKKEKIIPEKLKEVPIKGGALPIFPLEKTYSNRVILIGDAAGFINPITGEGIYYAMASGEIAANVISKALDKGRTDEAFLSLYEKIWKKDFGKDLKLIYKLVKRQDKNRSEKNFKITSKDKKLSEMSLGVMTGELSIQEYKWKIIRRFLYVSLMNRFKN